MPFKPGESGNPSGRPALTPELRQAREALGKITPKAVKTLYDLLDSVDDNVRSRVALGIIKTTLGDVSRTEISGVDGAPVQSDSRIIIEVAHDKSPEFASAVLGILVRSGALDEGGGARAASRADDAEMVEVHSTEPIPAADGLPSPSAD